MDFASFRDKHLRIRYKMLCAIDEKRRIDNNEISSDDGCEFGEWLHRQACLPDNQQTIIVELQDSHAQLHQEAQKIAELINAGRYDEADKRLGLCTPYSHCLLHLTNALAALNEQRGTRSTLVEGV